ncbi:general transcription factor IIH subunit 3 [Nilaparvata lugens]|uniref:general transcription factor IIH subunit 3 n=1 Tax=Nilaparvata lugens TaxID=108931 RepID=UPI000B98571D|nr:general transcription factor IIH subunit 3 [Nilaparvata lugens]
MTDAIETSLLVIVFDINPTQRILINEPQKEGQKFTHCVDAVIAFANSHLMLKPRNKLAVITSDAQTSKFIYPGNDEGESLLGARQRDGQYELFTHVEKTIRGNLQSVITNSKPPDPTKETLLAGAFAMALCYINRQEIEKPVGEKLNSRILAITGSSDSASQYMNYMNVFFTAQKQNVIIDICSLDHDLGLLQQGCDISGGLYLRIPQFQGLLQYLLWVFLPEPPIRKKLLLPPPVKVDYRASCFCHRQLIDIGYVCSVCLSIFCRFSPICTTCHAVFKTPGPLPIKPKKKKQKLG